MSWDGNVPTSEESAMRRWEEYFEEVLNKQKGGRRSKS